MEMVATSKMRKTQDRMSASRPYSETIRNVISHVSKASVGYKHPFLIQREVKKVGILVVSTDRGMCGGLNINLFKTVMTEIKQWKDKGVNVELGLIGSKGISFFRSLGLPVRAQLSGLGDNPTMEDLIGVANGMFGSYKDEEGQWVAIEDNTPVSMNMWGFSPDYFEYSEEYFKEFLADEKNRTNLKAEFFIPLMVNKLVNDKTATVKVLDTTSKWFGVTYSADREGTVERIQSLVNEGVYPSKLF